MAIVALPSDGSLYERFYPPAGGSATDAPLDVVILDLALYDAARRT